MRPDLETSSRKGYGIENYFGNTLIALLDRRGIGVDDLVERMRAIGYANVSGEEIECYTHGLLPPASSVISTTSHVLMLSDVERRRLVESVVRVRG